MGHKQTGVHAAGDEIGEIGLREADLRSANGLRFRLYLESVARWAVELIGGDTLVCYEDLAEPFGVVPYHWKLAKLLGGIQGLCFGLGLPCLPAAVVLKGTGVPSDGWDNAYIHWRRRFGLPVDLSDRDATVADEQDRSLGECDWGRLFEAAQRADVLAAAGMGLEEAVIKAVEAEGGLGAVPIALALILAGGVGERVGADVPKQFIEVAGKPILVHTIERFQEHPDVDEVEVVCIASYMDEMCRLRERFGLSKVTRIVEGGATYQDSVRAGMEGLRGSCRPGDVVSIHFGASPFVTPEIIADSIRVAREHGNGISSDPVVLCLAEKDASDGDRSSVAGVDRDRCMGLNSPQSFEWALLDRMYREGDERGIWGEIDPHTTSLMPALGVRLYFSRGSTANIKITTAEDVDLFRAWLAVRGGAFGEKGE